MTEPLAAPPTANSSRQDLHTAMLSMTAQFLETTDQDALLQQLCDHLVNSSPHILLAWIWIGSDQTDTIIPQIFAGPAQAYAADLVIKRDWITRLGPAFSVLNGAEMARMPISSKTLHRPWRKAVERFGFAEAVAIRLPLPQGDPRAGLVVFYSDRAGFFDEVGLNALEAFIRLAALALEQNAVREKLKTQAGTDILTGLPNRRALEEALERATLRAQRHQSLLAVVMIDLDGFKPINDQFGHEQGDHVLRALAQRMRGTLRRTDFVARLGGDEFVLILEDCRSPEEVATAMDKLADAVIHPIELPIGEHIAVGLSAGVALHRPEDTDPHPEQLLRQADQALYDSKRHKLDRQRFWTIYGMPPDPVQNASQRLLYHDQVRVLYQGIFDQEQHRIVGVEAQIRLRAGDGRLISPHQFLPELNHQDRAELTARATHRVMTDLAQWDHPDRPTLWATINLDPATVTPDLVGRLEQILRNGAVSPRRIGYEILEMNRFQDRERAIAELQRLKALGVRIFLDDVGSAYSSLLRIKSLPIDGIKIDPGFVRPLTQDPSGIFFVRTLLSLAENLGLSVIVNGVENDALADGVIVAGANLLQGKHITLDIELSELAEQVSVPLASVTQAHPHRFLGVYADHITRDLALRTLIQKDPQYLDLTHLGDARRCPVHHQLLTLNVPVDDPIFAIHDSYHRQLAAICIDYLQHQHRPDWALVKPSHFDFLQRLRDLGGLR